jgi:hypothetical protein
MIFPFIKPDVVLLAVNHRLDYFLRAGHPGSERDLCAALIRCSMLTPFSCWEKAKAIPPFIYRCIDPSRFWKIIHLPTEG